MTANMIRVEQLTSGYEKSLVFSDLHATIRKGKITTIIGPNGCGKSTLLKTIGRILKQQSGKIFLQEQDMKSISTKQIAKHLALLSQNPEAPMQLKVEELISYGRFPHRKNVNNLSIKDADVIEWAMDITKTTAFRDREIGQLSGGQRQKVWLAMALAQETDTLMLDEPTTYLDLAHQLEVLKIVERLNRENGCTVVMVLHDINHAARFSDELIAMREGKIVTVGSPEDILANDVLKQVFNIDARIMIDPANGAPVCFGYDEFLEQEENVVEDDQYSYARKHRRVDFSFK